MLKNKSITFLFLIIISIHGFILTKLIFFPFPEFFIYPYLTNQGLLPYSQILDQHFPGLMFLPINLGNLGMNSPEVARIWSIGIVIITQILLFFISKKIFKSSKVSLIVSTAYLIWQPFFEGWVFWIDSFLPLILLPAFFLLSRNKLFLTGLMLGIVVVFKQVMIPLFLLALIYLIWKRKNIKEVILFVLGFIVPIAGMLLYFYLIGVLGDFWYWTVQFNLTTYAQSGRGVAPTMAHLSRVALVFGAAFIVLIRAKEREGQLLLLFLIGTLFGLSTRFDFVHFQPVLPFAILSTMYGIQKISKYKIIKIGILLYLAVAVWWLITFYRGHVSEKIFFFDNPTYELADRIMLYTKPGEKIFVFGAAPHLYQMTKTLPAGDIFVFQFPWFFKVAEGRILEGIKKDQPNIVVVDRTVKIEEQSITQFGGNINQYINENYEKIDMVGQTEILRRK